MSNINDQIIDIASQANSIQKETGQNTITPARNSKVYKDTATVLKDLERDKLYKTEQGLFNQNKKVVDAINEVISMLPGKVDIEDNGVIKDEVILPQTNKSTGWQSIPKNNNVGYKMTFDENEFLTNENFSFSQKTQGSTTDIPINSKNFSVCFMVESESFVDSGVNDSSILKPLLINTNGAIDVYIPNNEIIRIALGNGTTRLAYGNVNSKYGHICYTINRTELKSYLNGVLVKTETMHSGVTDTVLRMGKINREISNLRVFNYTISDEEVSKLWNGGDVSGYRLGSEHFNTVSNIVYKNNIEFFNPTDYISHFSTMPNIGSVGKDVYIKLKITAGNNGCKIRRGGTGNTGDSSSYFNQINSSGITLNPNESKFYESFYKYRENIIFAYNLAIDKNDLNYSCTIDYVFIECNCTLELLPENFTTTQLTDSSGRNNHIVGNFEVYKKPRDFMFELVTNMEYSNANNPNPLFSLNSLNVATNAININGELVENPTKNIVHHSPYFYTTNASNITSSILFRKEIPTNKLFRILFGVKAGRDVFSVVNGEKKTMRLPVVHRAGNILRLMSAKHFALLRHYNFYDEDFWKICQNGGRWWEADLSLYMNEVDKNKLLINTDNFFIAGVSGSESNIKNGKCFLHKDVDGAPELRSKLNNSFIKRGHTYKISVTLKSNNGCNVVVGDANSKYSKIIVSTTSFKTYYFDIKTDLESEMLGVWIPSAEKLGSIVEIESIRSMHILDEFLPTSWHSTQAINTGSRNLPMIAMSSDTNFVKNVYTNPNPELITDTKAPVNPPDMKGQTYINTTNGSKYISKNDGLVSDWLQIL